MGKLKPIGSEKLEGMAKIQRMIEIARYKETNPQSINENSSNEYSVRLADGNKYHIIKEKNGYVIKKGINESFLDYIEPIKGRKYYDSYSQALKRLNLITKEVNILEGREENLSLFSEGNDEGKKYVLSRKRQTMEQAQPTTQTTTVAPTPAPAPAPAPAPETEIPTDAPEGDVPSPEETPMPDMEQEPSDMSAGSEAEGQEEVVTFKTIQKLTGKLGQKLRALNSDEENKMSSKDIKYVINSILSALDLNDLDDEDKDSIMNKFEGGEDMDDETPDMEDEMPDTEENPLPEPEEEPADSTPPPAPDVTEDYDSIDEDDDFGMKYDNMSFDETYKMDEMIEGIFSESKVDKILKRYFKLDEKEKRIIKERKEKKNMVKKAIDLSESISQEVAVRKFMEKNPKAKLLGKSTSNDLFFQINESKVKITKKGQIL